MNPAREFALTAAGALAGAALGAGFGALVGAASPEFIALVCHPRKVEGPAALGGAMGAVGGVMMGAAAMVAARLLGVLRTWAGAKS